MGESKASLHHQLIPINNSGIFSLSLIYFPYIFPCCHHLSLLCEPAAPAQQPLTAAPTPKAGAQPSRFSVAVVSGTSSLGPCGINQLPFLQALFNV